MWHFILSIKVVKTPSVCVDDLMRDDTEVDIIDYLNTLGTN